MSDIRRRRWLRRQKKKLRPVVEDLEPRQMLAVQPFPLPLLPIEPLGSLSYSSAVSAQITGADPIQSFTIPLDAQQRISVVATAGGSLAAEVTVLGPGGTPLATEVGSAGQAVVARNVPITAAGQYTVQVQGSNGTIGSFQLELLVNAAPERETFGGPSNNTLGSAELLEGFTSIGGPVTRTSVLGKVNSSGGDGEDWYRLPLADGQRLALLTGSPSGGPVTVELFNASQQLLARGASTATLDGLINHFTDRTADGVPTDYFVRVSGAQADYTLTAVLEAAADAELNNPADLAQAIGPSGRVAGTLGDLVGFAQLESQMVSGLDSVTADDFGWSVAIDGSWAIIGAPEDDEGRESSSGSAYLFHWNGVQWTEFQKIRGSDLTFSDNFGFHVAISGNWAFAGARFGDSPSQDDTGAVYVFEFDGTQWVERQKLTPSDPNLGQRFGESLAVDGGVLVVGAPMDDGSGADAGAAYVYELNGTSWVERQRLTAADAGASDHFGIDVDVSGSWLVVGARQDDDVASNAGAAYFFERTGSGWVQRKKVTASDGQAGDQFGRAVAISGGRAAIGAPEDDDRGFGAGKAYVFELRAGNWVETARLLGSDTTVADDFGSALDLDGNNLVIGARFAEAGAENSGAAYLFRFDGRQWVQERKLSLDLPSGSDFFSNGVGLSGDRFILGAPLHESIGLPSGAAVIYDILPQVDFYRVPVQAGDALTITTSTPLDGELQPVNLLDPALELLDPNGQVVVSNLDGAADGRNARLTHVATQSGTYLLRVSAEDQTEGDYLLEVTGHTGAAGFAVSAIDPSNGQHVAVAPQQLLVQFSDFVRLDTIAAADLTVGGVPATGVSVVDGKTLRFDLPPLIDGTHEVRMAAGAVASVQGTPLEGFQSSFVVDTVAPRIVGASHHNGDIIPVGLVTFTATFNEPMIVGQIDRSDVTLVGELTGSYEPAGFSYDVATSTLTVTYHDLPEDNFRLTLLSGPDHFQDLAGNDLDGERHPQQTVPSGDGNQGGDFVLHFGTDTEQVPLPAQFVAREPLGSLVYEASLQRIIGFEGDVDAYTVVLDAGQVLTVESRTDQPLQARIEVLGPGGTLLASSQAAAPAGRALAQTIPVDQAGEYTVRVSSVAGTLGVYQLRLLLNARQEVEEGEGTNNSLAAAEDLAGAMIDLPLGGASRAAVVGTLPPRLGTRLAEDNFESQVFDSKWTLNRSDSAGRIRFTNDFPPAVGNFAVGMDRAPGGGFTLNELILHVDLSGTTEALLSFAHADFGDEEHPLPDTFTGSVNGDGVAISADGVNWFTILNAPDTRFGEWQFEVIDLAAAAAQAGIPFTSDFQIKFQQYDNFELGLDGRGYDEVVVAIPVHGEDVYRFDLEAGQSATLALATLREGIPLSIVDSQGVEIATGERTANYSQFVRPFTSTNGGTYYARVRGNEATYTLMVARDTLLDVETNNRLDSAQSIEEPHRILGYLFGEPPIGQVQFTPPEESSEEPSGAPADPEDEGSPPPQSSREDEVALLPAALANKRIDRDRIASADRLIVRYDEDYEGFLSQLVHRRGAKIVQHLARSNFAVLELPKETDLDVALAQWSAQPGILYAEPDFLVQIHDTFPTDPRFADQWALHNLGQSGGTIDADIDAPDAWDLFTGSETVVIASIDTGVDYNHPDLAPNMWRNQAELNGTPGVDDDGNGFIDDIYGIDVFSGDSDPLDDNGHGTHTAGIMGAVGNNNLGIAGVNWNVQIMAVKFLGAGGAGTISGAIQALEYMTMMKTQFGVNVVASNNSWGGGGFSNALVDAIQASIDAGIVFVAAAGNSALNIDDLPHYPASYELDGIITVAASDRNDQIANFSNFGPQSTDLAAPGVGVLSTFLNNDYVFADGTSMAAPFVAGAVAMLKAAKPSATVSEIKQAILAGVDPVESMAGTTLTGGRLNLARSLTLLGDPGDHFQFQVGVGDELRIETASPGSGPRAFTNNIDLALQLYDEQGRLVAQARGPGNEVLLHTAASDGLYTLRVLSQANGGEYMVQIQGATGIGTFNVVEVTPGAGATLGQPPATVTIRFNDNLRADTVDPSDVTIDGLPATAVLQVDGRTAVFAVPVVGEGPHVIAVAAGSILDEESTPVEAFQTSFIVDLTPPTVTVDPLVTTDSTPPLGGTVDDPDATIQVALNGNVYNATNTRNGRWILVDNSIVALPDGVYDVRVTATDKAGNVGRDTTTDELVIDATPPVVTVDRLVTQDRTPPLSGTVDDPQADIQISLNGFLYTATNLGNGRWQLQDDVVNSLPDGTYEVEVSATDALGNVGVDTTTDELVIDNVPPAITVDVILASSASPELTGTVDDPQATITVRVQGKNYSANNLGDGRWLLPENTISPPLLEGTYDVQATATDRAGNSAVDSTNAELTIDLGGPSVSVLPLLTSDGSSAISGTVDDPGAVVDVTIDGRTYRAQNLGNGTWRLPAGTIDPPLADGIYDVHAVATDAAGNTNVDTTTDELHVDTTPPVVTVDPTIAATGRPALSGTVSETLASVEVTVQGVIHVAVVHTDGTWTIDRILTTLPDGTYDVQAHARDAVGNTGDDSSLNELVIDTTVPLVTIHGFSTSNRRPDLVGTINESAALVEVTLAGKTYSAVNHRDGTWSLSGDVLDQPLADGLYDVQVRATDLAGNQGFDTTTNELRIGAGIPSVTVDSLLTDDSSPRLSGTVTDPQATIQVRVGPQVLAGVNLQNGRWELPDNQMAPLPDGVYDVQVQATSSAGLIGTDGTLDELRIDTRPPQVTVDPLATREARPALTGTIDDPLATISVQVGGQSFLATNLGDGTWRLDAGTIGPLSDGTYDVRVTAEDLLGNTGTDATGNELRIDTTAPRVTVTALATSNRSPQLQGTVDDPTATLELLVAGTTYPLVNNGSGTWTLPAGTIQPPLEDGTYDVQVVARDSVGNEGRDTTSGELIVDNVSPAVTVDVIITSDRTPVLHGTINDPLAQIELTVNGKTYTAQNRGDGTWRLVDNIISPPLAEGVYDVLARAVDSVGNVGVDNSSNELRIDLTPPVVTIAPLTTANPSPALQGTVDDPAAVIRVTVAGSVYDAENRGDGTWVLAAGKINPPLTDGKYNVQVTAEDQAGNKATDSSSQELTIDTRPPVVTVDQVATTNPQPALTGTIDDPQATILVVVGGQSVAADHLPGGRWIVPEGRIQTGLVDGIYDVAVIATDTVGNEGRDATFDELIVDRAAPDVNVRPMVSNDPSPALGGGLTDPISAQVDDLGGGQKRDWGTLRGGAQIDPEGHRGSGLRLPGGNALVEVADSPDLNLNPVSRRTISLWFRLDQLPSDSSPRILFEEGDAFAGLNIYMEGGRLVIGGYRSGESPWATFLRTPAGAIQVGQWHHVALVLDAPESGDGTLTGYLDGTQFGSGVGRRLAAHGAVGIGGIAGSTRVDGAAQPIGPGNGFQGRLDELRVLNRALTAQQVQVLAQSGNVGAQQSVAYWAFDPPTTQVQVTIANKTYTAFNHGDGSWSLPRGTISPPLAEGVYDVSVTARDVAGNVGVDQSVNELLIDFSLPTITVNRLVTGDPTPPLTGTIDDPLAIVEVTINGNTYLAENLKDGRWRLPDNVIQPPLSEGTYDVVATARDSAGNVAQDTTTGELTIDRTAPVVTIDLVVTNDSTPALQGTINDLQAAIQVQVGGQTIMAVNRGDGTWILDDNLLSPLPDGVYDVHVTATDSLGNIGMDTSTDELTVDTRAPKVTFNRLVTNNNSPALEGTVDDPLAELAVMVTGQTFTPVNRGDGTWHLEAGQIGPLAEGIYEVRVLAVDRAGNIGVDPTLNDLIIDRTPPEADVDSIITHSRSPQLTGRVDDPDAAIQVIVQSRSYQAQNRRDGTWVLPAGLINPPLEEGTHTVELRVTDKAGNLGTYSFPDRLKIEIGALSVTVFPLVTSNRSPGLSGTVSDSAALVTVRVAGQTYTARNHGNGNWTLAAGLIPALADGTYDVEATATDVLGNSVSDTTANELVVDGTAPQVTVDRLHTRASQPEITGTVDDPQARIEVQILNNTFPAVNLGNGRWRLSTVGMQLSEGVYDVRVEATDAAGNVGHDQTADELVVDQTGPRVLGHFPAQDASIAPGDLTARIQLNEQIDVGRLDVSDVVLESTSGARRQADSVGFDPSTRVLTARFGGITVGTYSVIVIGGNNAIRDLAGNPLQGNVQGTSDYRFRFQVRESAIVGRYVFYNQSAFDGRDPSANAADDAARAPLPEEADNVVLGKTARLPGQPATFQNVSSFVRGINGLMIDVRSRPAGAPLPTAQDFKFATSADGTDGGTWTPLTVMPTVTLRARAGRDGSDRITLIWPSGTIVNTWLRVEMLATPATGLSAPDVFYWGSLVGETGDAFPDQITSVDRDRVAQGARNFMLPANPENPLDINRDGLVDGTDFAIVRDRIGDRLAGVTSSFVSAQPEGSASGSSLSELVAGALTAVDATIAAVDSAANAASSLLGDAAAAVDAVFADVEEGVSEAEDLLDSTLDSLLGKGPLNKRSGLGL